MIKKLLVIFLILVLPINMAFSVDLWMEGTGADVYTGAADSVSDIDTLLAASAINPLDRLLSTYINGFTLTFTDANTITVGIGEVVCSDGSVQRWRKNTSTFTIDLSTNSVTSGVDVNGDVDKASSWFHIYLNADANATTATGCASLSEASPTGVTYFKYIGSVFNNSGQDMLAFFWSGDGNDVRYMWDIPTSATSTVSAGAWSGAIDCSSSIPFSSKLGIFGLSVVDTSNEAWILIRPNGSTWATNKSQGISVKTGGADNEIGGQRWCATDGSQQIQNYNHAGDASTAVYVEGFVFQR